MLKISLFNRSLRTPTRFIFFSSNKNDQLVGVDLKGNQYFELNNGGILSRQVKYITNEYDPSLVHPLWLPWLQYKTDVIPSDEELRQYDYDQRVLKMKVRKIEQRDDLEKTFMQQNPDKYEEMCASPQSIRSMINSILEKNKSNSNSPQPNAHSPPQERQSDIPTPKKDDFFEPVARVPPRESSRPTPVVFEPVPVMSATSNETKKNPLAAKPKKIEMTMRQPGAGEDDGPVDMGKGKDQATQQAEAIVEARDEAERREEESKKPAPQSKLNWVDVNEDLL